MIDNMNHVHSRDPELRLILLLLSVQRKESSGHSKCSIVELSGHENVFI